MMRRICPIPFDYTIPEAERIERYEDVLLKEKRGILGWIVNGWKRYKTEGMKVLPPSMQKAMAEYTQECDSLRQFIEEQYVIENGELGMENAAVKLKDFTANYNAWCKENNYRSSNSRTLAGELRSAGYEVDRGHSNALYIRGMGILDD
jgi:phage/plasmid-associated DNA primase